jgi:lipopolysaccharide transport system permease protein
MSNDATVYSPRGGSALGYLNPLAMLRVLWAHRQLTWQLAKREIVARYRGSMLGLVWAVITPLLLLAVYTFAFAGVFGARWTNDPRESPFDFALVMFAGLLVFNLFVEVVNRSPHLIVGNANFVKRVVFPLEIIVVAALVSALINMLIGFAAWTVGWVVLNQALPHVEGLLLPVVLMPTILLTLGLGWLLSSLGVFLRDIGPGVVLVTQVLFFATPIFYSAEQVRRKSAAAARVIEANPLAQVIESVRQILIHGALPDWSAWGVALVVSAAIALLGYAFFMKSRRAFADVV